LSPQRIQSAFEPRRSARECGGYVLPGQPGQEKKIYIYIDDVSTPHQLYLSLGGTDDDFSAKTRTNDLNTRIAFVAELAGQKLIELRVEDTISNEMTLLVHGARNLNFLGRRRGGRSSVSLIEKHVNSTDVGG
jgi:hypothetical protein